MEVGDTIMRAIARAGLGEGVKPRYACVVHPSGAVRVSLGVEPDYRARVAALADGIGQELGADVHIDEDEVFFHIDLVLNSR